MRESKGDLTSRLRREGRWNEFVARREALKAEGLPAAEAWNAAAAEFPPPTPQSDENAASGEDVSGYDLSALDGKPQISMIKVVQWAFEHLDSPGVTPADAPSAGAWTMLTWARQNGDTRSEFMKTFMAKLMPNRQQVEDSERMSDDGVEVLEAIALCRQALTDAEAGRLNHQRSIARAVLQAELCADCLAAAQSRGIATIRDVEQFWREPHG